MRQMQRLDNDEAMKRNGSEEIARGNSISQNALTYIKTVNVGIRVIEMADKYQVSQSSISKQIGIDE